MKLKKTKLAGSDFFYQADDKHIGKRIAVKKFEPYLTRLFEEILKQLPRSVKAHLGSNGAGSYGVVLDVGANIGYYTVLAAKSKVKVYAFEPESVNYSILSKNIESSGMFNAHIFQSAVGNSNKKVKLEKSKENYGDHKIGSAKQNRGEEVDMVKLDDAVMEKVDVIKIDVQGWEPAVIEGAKKIIKKYRPVIIMEYWPEGIERAGLDGEKMINFLKQVYGKVFLIDEYVQYCYQGNMKALMKRNKRDDVSLIMGNISWWQRYKDFWVKKLVKRFLGKELT